MSLVKEYENFGPQHGWNNHKLPKQDKSLLDHERLSAPVETFKLRPVSMLGGVFRGLASGT